MRWPLFAVGALFEGAVWGFIEPPATLPVIIGLWTAWQVWLLRVALIHAWRKHGDGGAWLTVGRFLSSFLLWGVLAALAATPAYFGVATLRHLISN